MDTWTPAPILPEQFRAARALLGLAEQALADEAGVGLGDLQALEAGQPVADAVALTVRQTLEAGGAVFVPYGVCRRQERPPGTYEERLSRLALAAKRVAALPNQDPRSLEDLLYDEQGLPR